MGRLIRGLAANGDVRILAADASDVADEARVRHDLNAISAAALARCLTGAVLLASLLCKTARERVSLTFVGDGPLGGPRVEAGPEGSARGYVSRQADAVPGDATDVVASAIGPIGELRVARTLSNGETYQSTVALASGGVAEDLAVYLWQSEQTPSAVLIGERLSPSGSVDTAAGVMVQVLPGCSPEIVEKLERNVREVGDFAGLVAETSLEDAVEQIAAGLGYEGTDMRAIGLAASHLPIAFRCRCSRERALSALAHFTDADRSEMARDGGTEIRCDWCGMVYAIAVDELQ